MGEAPHFEQTCPSPLSGLPQIVQNLAALIRRLPIRRCLALLRKACLSETASRSAQILRDRGKARKHFPKRCASVIGSDNSSERRAAPDRRLQWRNRDPDHHL